MDLQPPDAGLSPAVQGPLASIGQTQRQRLSHIDFRLRFLGTISRADLVARFGIKEAAATRDLSLYRRLAPDNLGYDTRAKAYTVTRHYRPLFDYSPQQALTALASGSGDDRVITQKAHIPCETPTQLNQPQLDTIAVLSRAIHQQHIVHIAYHSLSSGRSEREIAPFALIDNGLRWHVRGWDRRRQRFSDFVINRMESPLTRPDSPIAEHEQREQDIQWNRIVELEIVPHPRLNHPQTIALEYAMRDGCLHSNVRAALAGYILRRWNVDCSADHHLDSAEIHLWLRNRAALYGVQNLVIAPGYDPQD